MTLDPTLRDQLARVIHDAACRCGGPIHHRHYLTAADKAAELLQSQPAPIVLPTVEEVAAAILAAQVTGEGWHMAGARGVLDLIASRVRHWVPVEPGAVKPGMVLKRTDRNGGYTVFTVKHVEEYGDKYRRARGTNGFYVDPNDDRFTWEVDPATVPAEPEDPRVAVIAEWMNTIASDNPKADYLDLLARLDALEADR